MIFCRKKTKDKRKKRWHKGRGQATCRRIQIDAMIAVELGPLLNWDRTARNPPNCEDRFRGHGSYSSIDVEVEVIVEFRAE